MDLNKEIKLSDLFRRRAKEPDEVTGEAPKPEQPKKERRSLFSRGEKPPQEPKAPKAPKEKRGRRGKAAAVEPKGAPALPQIPLMRAVNLLPRDEPREKGTRLGVPQIAVALLGVLLVAGLAGGYLFTSAGVASKQAELDDLRAQLAELEVTTEAPAESGASLATESVARATALSAALSTRVAWDRVLRELSLVLPDGVWLTQIAAVTANAADAAAAAPPAPGAEVAAANSLTLAGSGVTQEDVAVFLARLATIPEFTSVQLQSSARTEGEDGSATFQFSILVGVDPLGVPSS